MNEEEHNEYMLKEARRRLLMQDNTIVELENDLKEAHERREHLANHIKQLEEKIG
jgi:uncharacterized protein YlxW (UPF0749 family)